ncbi:hypothetical protein ElyMa_005366000 [Elysia marginata]|uniref:Uncharacterized protein n=1 Tax=Elysia marginata TaxID=1093978 RepID=A0AAV4EDP5_9GAST|nr:hypothetical protein ElyMa_005366000 [Elysia marginata]
MNHPVELAEPLCNDHNYIGQGIIVAVRATKRTYAVRASCVNLRVKVLEQTFVHSFEPRICWDRPAVKIIMTSRMLSQPVVTVLLLVLGILLAVSTAQSPINAGNCG